jgi:hypothetical protein
MHNLKQRHNSSFGGMAWRGVRGGAKQLPMFPFPACSLVFVSHFSLQAGRLVLAAWVRFQVRVFSLLLSCSRWAKLTVLQARNQRSSTCDLHCVVFTRHLRSTASLLMILCSSSVCLGVWEISGNIANSWQSRRSILVSTPKPTTLFFHTVKTLRDVHMDCQSQGQARTSAKYDGRRHSNSMVAKETRGSCLR